MASSNGKKIQWSQQTLAQLVDKPQTKYKAAKFQSPRPTSRVAADDTFRDLKEEPMVEIPEKDLNESNCTISGTVLASIPLKKGQTKVSIPLSACMPADPALYKELCKAIEADDTVAINSGPGLFTYQFATQNHVPMKITYEGIKATANDAWHMSHLSPVMVENNKFTDTIPFEFTTESKKFLAAHPNVLGKNLEEQLVLHSKLGVAAVQVNSLLYYGCKTAYAQKGMDWDESQRFGKANDFILVDEKIGRATLTKAKDLVANKFSSFDPNKVVIHLEALPPYGQKEASFISPFVRLESAPQVLGLALSFKLPIYTFKREGDTADPAAATYANTGEQDMEEMGEEEDMDGDEEYVEER